MLHSTLSFLKCKWGGEVKANQHTTDASNHLIFCALLSLCSPLPPPTHTPPKQDVADACRTGPATDIIFGLALGYKSTIIPCFVIAICIYIGNTLGGMLGIACAALGMLSTLSTGLAIDA